MEMTLSEIITHIKTYEHITSSDTDFLKLLTERFSFRYAELIDDSKLITSASVSITTTGYQDLSLSANFLRPLNDNSFWYAGDLYTKIKMKRLTTAVKFSEEESDYHILYINANSCKITPPKTGTLNYWYIKKPAQVALSGTPDIDAEYIIEGTRGYYKHSQGLISKADLDAWIWQTLQQAKVDNANMDKKINAYIHQENKLNGTFRG